MDKRILIVDDDPGIRLLYEKELSQAGFTVTTVATGQEALEKAGENRFHLAILDIDAYVVKSSDLKPLYNEINKLLG